MADEESNIDVDELRNQIKELDSNQEDLIQIMTNLREKIVELSSAEPEEVPDVDSMVEGIEEEMDDLEKKLRQHKLKEGKDIAALKEDIRELQEEFETQTASGGQNESKAEPQEQESASSQDKEDITTDIEAVWNEVEGLGKNQKELSKTLAQVQRELEYLDLKEEEENNETPVEPDNVEELMARFDEQATEIGKTVEGIERMFRDVGFTRKQTEALINSKFIEHEEIEHRVDELDERMKQLAIEEKVDRSELGERIDALRNHARDTTTLRQQVHGLIVEEKVDKNELEQEIEQLRDKITDFSWVEERLEQISMDEATDHAEVQQELNDIYNMLLEEKAERHDLEKRVERMDLRLSREISRIQQKAAGLEELLDHAQAKEAADIQQVYDIIGQLEDVLEAGKDDEKALLNALKEDVSELLKAVENVSTIGDVQDQVEDLERDLKAVDAREESDVEDIKERINEVKDDLRDRLAHSEDERNRSLDKLEGQLETLRNKLQEKLDAEAGETEISGLENEIDMLEQRIAEKQEVDEMKEKLIALTEKHASTEKELQSVQNELKDTSQKYEELAALQTKMEHNRGQLKAINRKLDNIPQSDAYQSYVDSQVNELEDHVEELSQLVLTYLNTDE